MDCKIKTFKVTGMEAGWGTLCHLNVCKVILSLPPGLSKQLASPALSLSTYKHVSSTLYMS